MKKIIYLLMSVFVSPLLFVINCKACPPVIPENFSSDVFSFNKTTDEECLELAEFLTDEDMMKYFYGFPLSFESKEDALLHVFERNVDGSRIDEPTGKEAINYTIRCAEQGNAVIGQVSFGYPDIVTDTNGSEKITTAYTNVSYIIGRKFQGHSYAFRAVKAFIDEFYKLNEKSEVCTCFDFECNPLNIASIKTIEKLGAEPLPDFCTDEYRYYKKSVDNTMCEIKIERFNDEELRNVSTLNLPKKVLHKILLDLKDGECYTIRERKFCYRGYSHEK